MATFNPYHIWLGIPPEDQPPSHYRLLGIPELESNPDVIDAGAEQQTVFLRTFQTGEQAELAEQLLNEVSAARVCLLDVEQKAEYDQQLQVEMQPAPVVPQPSRRTQPTQPIWQQPRMLAAAGGAVVVILLLLVLSSGRDKPSPIRNPEEREAELKRLVDEGVKEELLKAEDAAARAAMKKTAAGKTPDKPAMEKTAAETLTLKGHSSYVMSVAFSPDGRRIVSGSHDNTVKVWDAETGQETLTLKGHSGWVWSVSFSPDGRRIVTGSADNTLKVWDAETGKRQLALQGHSDSVISVSFSPDGRRIVSASDDKLVKVWNAETGQLVLTLNDRAKKVSFSPDGRRIVSGSHDNTVKVWDAETGQEIFTLTLQGYSGSVWSVAFSPDGRRVSGSSNDTLKVWDAETGQELHTLKGHSRVVNSVAFSPDGKRIVSGSYDNTLKVWDAETGQETLTLKGHSRSVRSVAFSPDGKRIVSGSSDSTLKVWNGPSLDPNKVATENSIGMKLALIPAGEFQMGSPDSESLAKTEEKPQHLVKITKPFYLGVHEVTQQQYEKVMGSRPWQGEDYVKEGADYPAVYVSHDDAVEFCRRLSKQEGVEYRLPTEAEWEYACRARTTTASGTTTAYSFGDDAAKLGQYAWYRTNAWDVDQKYAHRVGQKLPNRWRLYDMHGNAWEWCQDWYAPYASEQVVSDPLGPAEGEHRVLRGGSFVYLTSYVRSAYRRRQSSGRPGRLYVGFRVARTYSVSP